MTEKGLSEKEVVFQLIKDKDVDFVLKAFNEHVEKKNVAFKKMRIKQLLNGVKQQKDKLPPFELLQKQLAFPPLKGADLEQVLDVLNVQDKMLPDIAKYFTLKEFQPAFFKENYEGIKQNILAGEFLLKDIGVFQNEQQVKDYYLSLFPSEDGSERAYIHLMIEWFETHIEPLDKYEKQVEGMDLVQFDLSRRQSEDGNGTGLLLALLKTKTFEDEKLYHALIYQGIHDCFIEANSKFLKQEEEHQERYKQMYERMEKIERESSQSIKEREQESKNTNKRLEKEIEKAKKEFEKEQIQAKDKQEQVVKDLNKEHQAQLKELNAQIKEMENQHKKELFNLKEAERSIEALNDKIMILEAKLQYQEDLKTNYKWALQTNYSSRGLVVFHKAPMIYAQNVFPDIQFVTQIDQIKEPQHVQIIFVQKHGISRQQHREIQNFIIENKARIVELGGKEEREHIMFLAKFLSN